MASKKASKAVAAPENISAIVRLMQERGVASPEPVTADYVMGLYRWKMRDPEEQGLRRYISESRQLREMSLPVKIPAEYKAITKEVHTPYYRDNGFRVAASLVKDPPILLATARDEGVDADKAASIGSKWTMAMLSDMNRVANMNITYESALKLVFDSESVIKTVHKPDAWANFPVRAMDEGPRQYAGRVDKHRKGGVKGPFASRVVDRMQMVFGDGEYGDEWCIEYGEYPRPYLDRAYGTAIDTEVVPVTTIGGTPVPENYPADTRVGGMDNRGMSGRAIKYEYFDAYQWHVVIDGKDAPGFPKPNPYCPFLPYQRAISYPVLYPLRYLVPALDALLTMQQNWAYLSAFPVVVMEPLAGVQAMLDTLPIGDTNEPNPNQTWRPGKIYFPPNDRTMRFLEPPQSGADLRNMISEFRELIDIAGIPSVMRGAGGSRQPGYSINQLLAAGQVTYKQLGDALERQEEMRAAFLWNCVDYTIKDDVYVLGDDGGSKRWIGLSGKEKAKLTEHVAPVSDLGPPQCTFRPVLPTDEQAEAMIGLQELNSPRQMLSHETILTRRYQLEDPVAELDAIAVETALNAPDFQQDMMDQARRELGLPVKRLAPPPDAGLGGAFTPNDATNSGEATVPLLTQGAGSGQGVGPNGLPLATGGRVAGSFPGQPSNQGPG